MLWKMKIAKKKNILDGLRASEGWGWCKGVWWFNGLVRREHAAIAAIPATVFMFAQAHSANAIRILSISRRLPCPHTHTHTPVFNTPEYGVGG